ncbi:MULTISPECIES: hypothetical protein [Cysteiniphilum]|uniref:Uncharacterized protein n=1 Tax=Cysteiniphilum litorale TaxID=2056700 RepID=A0A8J3E9T4_9GAMM|nr:MULTISPECIES: hypothetical protein [Cysteiniphilum]GGG03959.1 hypothetical protein GCM10010995_21810 [Cysteiniphilum litorale]
MAEHQKTTPKTLADLVPYGITALDSAYVNRKLIHTRWFSQLPIIEQYCQIWIDEYNDTPIEYKKANNARRKANLWISNELNKPKGAIS